MNQQIRFGLCTDQNLSWDKNIERWQLFEKLGFDSAWNCDHLIQPSRPTGPYFEAWTNLAALASMTRQIRIGCLVTSNTFRHPAIVAKMALSVDHISSGRLELGIGAGWYEPEHSMFGIPFPATGELIARFEEAVQVIDVLLRNDTASFAGKFYRVEQAIMRPGPLQKPRPPLTIGANKPRMLMLCARYADTWNSSGTVAEWRERSVILDESCAKIGRDPGTIRRSLYYWIPRAAEDPWQSVGAFEDVIERYRNAGANEFILDHPRDDQLDVLERVATEVIPRFRTTDVTRS